MNRFEGSFLGDSGRIDDHTVMECGVCWWVYNPAKGDDVWQVPADTPFSRLPGHWRCPKCDAAPSQFMQLRDAGVAGRETDENSAHSDPVYPADPVESRAAALTAAYQRAAKTMRSLPVYNHRLGVEVVGMRLCEQGLVGVAATPWCMNLVLIPEGDAQRREGSSRDLEFPSGRYPFITGHLEGLGTVETCSLFSPMDAFEDPDAVSAVAREAMEALFKSQTRAAAISRREFLRPGTTG